MSTDIEKKEQEIDDMLTTLETKIDTAISPELFSPPNHALIIKFNHESNHRIPQAAGRIMVCPVLSGQDKIPPEQKNTGKR